MKRLYLTVTLIVFFIAAYSQTGTKKDVYVKASGGRVSFGTGDFLGYSLAVEASENLMRRSSFAVDKLLLGGELIFENGVKNPVVNNPSFSEFLQTFHHVSSTIIWAKLSYYPFKRIVKGFNVQLGPTAGYSYRSSEKQAARNIDALGQATRTSRLFYNNGFTYGYRIGIGIEWNVGKTFLTGCRLDFSNNNEAEINTLAGLKVGIRL